MVLIGSIVVLTSCFSVILAERQRDPQHRDCGTVFPTCSTNGGSARAYYCPANGRNRTCVPRRNWCSVDPSYKYDRNCPDFSNLMLENCLNVDFELNGRKYHLNLHESGWNVAEQYCQSRKYHLVTFDSQGEYDDVVRFLEEFKKNPASLARDRKVKKFEDKLAQSCWDELKDHSGKLYWTGYFVDKSDGKWKTPSGSKIQDKIRSLDKSLGEAFRISEGASENYRYAMFYDRNFTFVIEADSGASRYIGSPLSKARILCKKADKFRKWGSGVDDRHIGCITGFKCTGKPKCITGNMFTDSNVCDGIRDCENSDVDERSENCHFMEAIFPDGQRRAHFVPMLRSVEAAKAICASRRMSLPSLHSDADVKFLHSLPKIYSKQHRGEKDFNLVAHDWVNLKMQVLVGIRQNQEKWTDGSKIDYRQIEISALPIYDDVFLPRRGKLNTKYDYDKPKLVFPICQTGTYNPYILARVGAAGGDRKIVKWLVALLVSLVLL